MRLFRALLSLHPLLHRRWVSRISNRLAQFAHQRPCGKIASVRATGSFVCEQFMRTTAVTVVRARPFLSSTSRAQCRVCSGFAHRIHLVKSKTSTTAFGRGSNRLGSDWKLSNMRKLSGLICTHTDGVNQEGVENMTVVQLRKLLRARGLKVSGCKGDLIDRLSSIPSCSPEGERIDEYYVCSICTPHHAVRVYSSCCSMWPRYVCPSVKMQPKKVQILVTKTVAARSCHNLKWI